MGNNNNNNKAQAEAGIGGTIVVEEKIAEVDSHLYGIYGTLP